MSAENSTKNTTGEPGRPLEPARQLIDGTWGPADHQLPEHLSHPADGSPLQSHAATSSEAVESATAAAWRDHRTGIGSPQQRAEALRIAADELDKLSDTVATRDSLNSGVPITVTRLVAGSLGATFRGAADQIGDLDAVDLGSDGREVHLYRLPLGPAAVLAPWNAPTVTAAKKAAFAWAAGCPVIVKPSPWSPNGTVLLIGAMHRAASIAGLSRASVQLVLGGAETGQALVDSSYIRAVSFTGSRGNGRAVAAAAAGNLAALQLELGSNNPAVVLPDADLDLAAGQLAAGMTKLNGAWCESPGTVFVAQPQRDRLIQSLVTQLEQVQIGDPLDEQVTFGPQSNPPQYRTLRKRIDDFTDGGARVVTIGDSPPAGHWILPTLVIDPPATLSREEVFGPVLVIRTYDDAEEAVEQAYALTTGLAAYVFTRSLAEGRRVGQLLPAGEVKVNGTSILDMSPRSEQHFWYGSGIGGHGDAQLMRFFTGARIVGEDVDSPL